MPRSARLLSPRRSLCSLGRVARGRADDMAVEQTSTRSILAGQADIRIVGAHYSADSSAPNADVRLAQRDVPLPLPFPADSNSQRVGTTPRIARRISCR